MQGFRCSAQARWVSWCCLCWCLLRPSLTPTRRSCGSCTAATPAARRAAGAGPAATGRRRPREVRERWCLQRCHPVTCIIMRGLVDRYCAGHGAKRV